jgi:alkylation response protein AidB-like acyl-CoA dehydrogenase
LVEFFDRELPAPARRAIEHPFGPGDGADADKGYDRSSWSRLAELGILRLALAGDERSENPSRPRQGDAVVAVEQMGRALYHSPYLDTMMAADLVEQTGPEGQRGDFLERIGQGRCTVAAATLAGGDEDPSRPVGVDASEVSPGRWTISGHRRFVPFARAVDYLLVIGSGPQPTIFLVPTSGPGISFRRQDDVGRGHFHAVTFEGTPVSSQDMVDQGEGVAERYAGVLARARIRQAAYLVGMCRGAFELTLAYTKERQQFGQKIARFQSITFRLSAMAARIEGAKLMVHHAAWLADNDEELTPVVPETLALAADLARDVTAEAIQMHGAIGYTEEGEPQRYFRWAAVESVRMGTPTQLRGEALAHLAERAVPAAG